MHKKLQVMVRLSAIFYLLFLLVSLVHAPTTAFFTATSTVEGVVKAGNYAEATPNTEAEESAEKEDTTQVKTDKGTSTEKEKTDEQSVEEVKKSEAQEEKDPEKKTEVTKQEPNEVKEESQEEIDEVEEPVDGGETNEQDNKESE